jgi:predicted metalloprotease with PDZ domain
LLSPAGPAAEPDEAAVRHVLSFPRHQNQYVHVNLQLPVEGGQVELAMPSWTPGSYQIFDFAAQVEGMRAQDREGRYLDLRKVAKNRWLIDAGDARLIIVNYDVWAGNLTVSTSWVDSDYALLNGAGIFLYSGQSLDRQQQLQIQLPSNWRQAHTSLQPLTGEHEFIAQNYDELVDSPILAGNAPVLRFETLGQDYVLVTDGQTRFWDADKAVEDVTEVVESVQEFWRHNPFERPYWFLNVLAVGSAGLEHDHSTVMLASPWQMRNRTDYVKWLGLVSHEFFHAWNVRRMRPQALATYDYDKEVYSRELWLAEGVTSYYDNLLLFRSGLITVVEFFELMAAEFHKYETVPGREVRSAEQSSFDAWIKHYQPDANNINSTVSYYRRGAVIGFVTDIAIRRETQGEYSLDDVMRRMYMRYGPPGNTTDGYPPGAFEQIVAEFAGEEVRGMVHALITTTSDPDLDDALDWLGLKLNRHHRGAVADESTQEAAPGLGINWDKDTPLLVVDFVIHGSSAAVAGVLPGDELLALSGSRVVKENIVDRMYRLRPGESIELTISRHGRVFTLPAVVGEAIPEKYLITADANIRNREKARLEDWLGRALTFSRN